MDGTTDRDMVRNNEKSEGMFGGYGMYVAIAAVIVIVIVIYMMMYSGEGYAVSPTGRSRYEDMKSPDYTPGQGFYTNY